MKEEIIENLQVYTQVLSQNINTADVLANLLNTKISENTEYLRKLENYVLKLKQNLH